MENFESIMRNLESILGPKITLFAATTLHKSKAWLRNNDTVNKTSQFFVKTSHFMIKLLRNKTVQRVIVISILLSGIVLKYHYFGWKSLKGGVFGAYLDEKLTLHARGIVKAKRKAMLEDLGLPLHKFGNPLDRACLSWSLEVMIRRYRRKKLMAHAEMALDCHSPFPKRILQANIGSSFRPFIQDGSYDVIPFDAHDLRGLIKADYPKLLKVFDDERNLDHQVFLWSLCAVHRYGGVVFGPNAPFRNTNVIADIQQLSGSRHGMCLKMGYVQHDEDGHVNLIAASPKHPLIHCMIKNLENKQSLEAKGSILSFYLDHATKEFGTNKVFKNLLVASTSSTFDYTCPDDMTLGPFSEISSPIDHDSILLYLEETPSTTTPEVSSVSSITVSISEREKIKPAPKTTHTPLAFASSGCEPGWLCDRCVRSPTHGTFSACSVVCNTCYIQGMCEPGYNQPEKAIIEYDIHVKIPPQRIGQRLIPRIVHQTWFEDISAVRYPELYRLRNSWKYSGWEYRFYNETETRAYVKDNFPGRFLEAYDALIPGAFKADLFRYLVLLRDGGVYADVDLLLETNLDSFIPPTLSFFSARDDGVSSEEDQQFCLWNGLLASAPGHPIMARAAERVLTLVLNRADAFDMEQEMCHFSGPDDAEPWKVRLARVLLLSGPCALGVAVNHVLGKSSLLSRIELGWQPFNTSADVPKSFGEGLIIKTDKGDMEAHRITDVDRNIMLASTDMVDLTKSPLLPPLSTHRSVRTVKRPEIPQHYSYLEFFNQVFGSVGVYTDDQVHNEIIKLSMHYDES
jgi:Glycosyltransferase sugar-binding region containing DXD motif